MSGQTVNRDKINRIVYIIFSLLVCVCDFAQANNNFETVQRFYPVPEHGELVLDVPAKWEVTYFSPAEDKPPVITFYEMDEQRQEIFQLNLSPLWDDGYKRNITAPEQIRKLVEEVGQSVLEMSDESELVLQSIQGIQGEGFFFSLTDSSAVSGEYRHLTQGAMSVGEIIVVFSLFTHKPDSDIHEKAMKMLQSAVHRLQRHV